MSRRRHLAVLIAGAIAAAGGLAWSGWPPPSDYEPYLICFELIGSSFLVAGIAAWVRWPASRLGLLFSVVGYLYLVPYILVDLANPVAFTIGNLSQGVFTLPPWPTWVWPGPPGGSGRGSSAGGHCQPPQPASFQPGNHRPAPAGAAGRPGPVRDQHGAGADGARRARYRYYRAE